jgi:16S rRNA A1518/A1519 N6-dimethyltransferase RsmA/KsgA/DIM1 with predicted DNA glycosylase/AP lyase activity
VLHSAFKERLTKPDADAILAELNIGPTARAEELSVETLLELSRVVKERLGETS